MKHDENENLQELRQRTERLAQTRKDYNALKSAIEAQSNIPEKVYTDFNPHLRRRQWTAIAAVLMVALIVGVLYRVNNLAPQVESDMTSSESATSAVLSMDDETEDDYGTVYQALRKAFDANSGAVYNYGSSAMTADTNEITAASADAGLGTGGYGETNVQVEGVDEADFIKNDGENIYILSGGYPDIDSQSVSVVRAADLKLLSQTANFKENYYFTELYLVNQDGEKLLVVIGSSWGGLLFSEDETADSGAEFQNQYPTTIAMIYQVGDDGSLTLQREFLQEGSYNSSRLVGDNLYLVSSKYVYEYEDLLLTEDSVKTYVPNTRDSAGDNSAVPISVSCIAIAPEPENTFTVISALALGDESKTQTQTLLGKNGSTVYSTAETMYVASYNYSGSETEIYLQKYALGDGTVSLAAEGTVPGYLNNQFSMDESGGNLRIVTTNDIVVTQPEESELTSEESTSSTVASRRIDDVNSENRLYVLDESLNIIGTSEALAPGEYVQSVRFMGDMAYVVTYRQTDPLFALDLSEPSNPQVLGYLKIPGFSTYMHPIDENTLIGIGFDADEETGATTGLKFSLFDVSDPANPVEHSKLIISGGCYSEATYNHKAVTYLSEQGILAVPITIYDTIQIDGEEITVGDSGEGRALILEVSKDTGFTVRGMVSDLREDNGYYGFRDIRRITYIGDQFYTISYQSVLQVDMGSLEILSQLDFFETEPMDDNDADDDYVIDEDFGVEPASSPSIAEGFVAEASPSSSVDENFNVQSVPSSPEE